MHKNSEKPNSEIYKKNAKTGVGWDDTEMPQDVAFQGSKTCNETRLMHSLRGKLYTTEGSRQCR